MNQENQTLKKVVVTRPLAQSQGLCDALESAGFDPFLFPTIEIIKEESIDFLTRDSIENYLHADIWIFLSENAVEHGLALFEAHDISVERFPCIAAIGDKTAEILRAKECTVEIVSASPPSSEKLLEHFELQSVSDKRIIIFCAAGGRTVLSETLQVRGAMVESVFVYRRVCPSLDPAPIVNALKEKTIRAIIITSVAGLENLQILLHEYVSLLQHVPFVVGSERIANYAKNQGLHSVSIASGTDDESILVCLLKKGKRHDE